jgi:hypothetical protein
MLYRRIFTLLAALAMVFECVSRLSAEQVAPVEFVPHLLSIDIAVGHEMFATYVYGGDSAIPRPYFKNVRAPDRTQVTRNYRPIAGKDTMDHPEFHPGIWMAFGDISGNDYWRLKAPVRHEGLAEPFTVAPGKGSFAVRNRYISAQDPDKTICNEVCRFTFYERPAGTLVVWDSTFTGDDEFSFGDQEEMGLGIRVATPMRVEKGDGSLPPGTGTITDAKGRKNGAEVGGNSADWCDYSGTVDGKHVGITIFCHPDNFRPSWFHARDYGFVAANAFGRAVFKKGEPSKIVVKPGDEFRLRYGILVHADGDGQLPDLNAAYQDYVQLAREAN